MAGPTVSPAEPRLSRRLTPLPALRTAPISSAVRRGDPGLRRGRSIPVTTSCAYVLIHPRGPPCPGPPSPRSSPMSRYVAPLGFTLAAVWVAVLFVLAGGGH
ncbi:hypothetical protein ABZ744_14355 [Micromonospora chersina]|uniref:hypothetical protein n=1 Tax=Micromonospora chersina TaxID=47854 RepID=UPI0033E2F9FE